MADEAQARARAERLRAVTEATVSGDVGAAAASDAVKARNAEFRAAAKQILEDGGVSAAEAGARKRPRPPA